MRERRRWLGALAGALVALACPPAVAVESDPLEVPKGTPRDRAIVAYNDGVKLMLEKRYLQGRA